MPPGSTVSANATAAPNSRAAEPRRRWKDSGWGAARLLAIPALLVLATVLVDLVFLPAPYPSDQINYFQAARSFPSVPENTAVVHQYMRIGLVMPMALAIKLLGYSQAAYYVVPIVAGVALALSVYAMASMLFSRAVGVAATLLTLGSTPIFSELATPLPDVLATALFCCALAVAIAVRLDVAAVGSDRQRIAVLLGIGVLLGWSYLTREYIVFGWPIVALVLLRPARWRDLLWVGIPLVAVGIGEMALNSYLYGDPLARLHVASAHGSGPVPPEIAATYQRKPRSFYLGLLMADLAKTPEGAWLVAALVATVLGAIIWPRRLGLFVAWSLAFYIPLVLLGGVLNPAQPSLRLTVIRYWYPLFPAFLIGATAAVWLSAVALASRVRVTFRYTWVAVGAVTLVLAAVPTVVAQAARGSDPTYRINGATHLEQFRSWLSANSGSVRTLWAAPRTAYLVEIFMNGPFGGRVWNGTLRQLSATAGLEQSQGDDVLLYSAYSPLCGHCRLDAQQMLGNPVTVPPSWETIYGTPDDILRVYVVR